MIQEIKTTFAKTKLKHPAYQLASQGMGNLKFGASRLQARWLLA